MFGNITAFTLNSAAAAVNKVSTKKLQSKIHRLTENKRQENLIK